MFTKHDSRNFFSWLHKIITNRVKLIRREQVEMLLPWWTTSAWNALLRCAVSRTKFSVLLLPLFYEIHIFKFPCCSTREDLSIGVSITNVGVILMKLRWFHHFVRSQNSNFKLKKKNQIFGFPCCSTCENLSVDVSITNVGLILAKLR